MVSNGTQKPTIDLIRSLASTIQSHGLEGTHLTTRKWNATDLDESAKSKLRGPAGDKFTRHREGKGGRIIDVCL